jgi:cell division protein ZapA
MTKQLEVTIMGQSYLLGCPEGGEQALLTAVVEVDREMSAIRDAGKVRARERIAVLAALNLAYALARQPEAVPATKQVERLPSDEQPDVDALVKRIDALLGSDGQLL